MLIYPLLLKIFFIWVYTLYLSSDIIYKNPVKVLVLLNFDIEINAKTPSYVVKLGLNIGLTNIRAKKIYGSTFKTFGKFLASLYIKNKVNRICVF